MYHNNFYKPKNFKRKYQYEEDDTEDDEDDIIEVHNDKNFGKKKRKNNESIELPGGIAIRDLLANNKNNKKFKSQICEVPNDIAKWIRLYLNHLFGAMWLQVQSLALQNKLSSVYAIPGIVCAILEYNNLFFRTIKYTIVKRQLIEPIWYSYSISKNELKLYIDEYLYDEYCIKNGDKPVLFTSGVVPLQIFNLYKPEFNQEINLPMIHCALACDHVSQHIISDIMNPNKIACADIHENFTNIGTTLHSMFVIERIFTTVPKKEYHYSYVSGNKSTYINTVNGHNDDNDVHRSSSSMTSLQTNNPSFQYTIY